MTKNVSDIGDEGGHISKKSKLSKSDMTFKSEESKLDPLVSSGDYSHAVTEGGLIHTNMPPSATHTKNT